MKKYCITFRSITYAQKGERLLKRAGVDCLLRRTPKALSNKECGYCLQIRPVHFDWAMELLEGDITPYGKVYGIDHTGNFEELTV